MFSAALQEACKDLKPGAHIYIAYSGGVDSQVLLHVASRWARQRGFEVTALHLNHGLSPNADDWQDYCTAQCEALGLPLLIERVDLGGSSASALEQRARNARYAWFQSLLSPGDALLMAHHREDQSETFVLRAMRGSGVRGLAAIPAARKLGVGHILRPFLSLSKSDIVAYAEQKQLSWVEDESNLFMKFDRNYIRHQVMPQLKARWPQASIQLLRSAQNCRDDQQLLDELAELDACSCRASAEPLFLEVLPALNLAGFRKISHARQRNLLQYLLRPLFAYPVPPEQMNEWLRQVSEVALDTCCELKLEGVSLLIHDQQLHFTRTLEAQTANVSLEWCTSSPLVLEHYGYELRLVSQAGTPAAQPNVIAFEVGETVSVHWRQGGERVQLQGEAFSRSLKKVYQEKRVAPWLRAVMPLISVETYIVWSASLGDFSPRLVDSQGRVYSFELHSTD